MKPDHVLCLKVNLRDVKPPIWRRIEIASDASFWDLHTAIQDAMGWADTHLHSFTPAGRDGDRGFRIGIPPEAPSDPAAPATLPGWRLDAAELITLAARTFRYEYDFGDGWVHDVRLEWIRPLARDESPDSFPRCTAGRRRCPPEDIGGPHRYQELLDQHSGDGRSPLEGADLDAFDPGAVVFEDSSERLARVMGPH